MRLERMNLLFGFTVTVLLSIAMGSLAWAVPLTYGGKPIHPGCIRELAVWISDRYPIVADVDLAGCMSSAKYSTKFTKERGAFVLRDPILLGDEDKGFGKPYFSYEQIGQTQNGIFVVQTCESGGGSGIFEMLYLLRLGDDRMMEDAGVRERKLLKCVGHVELGDRVLVKISIRGNKVEILSAGERKARVVDLSHF